MSLEDYRTTLLGCTRCSYCKWIPLAHVKSWRFAKGCPSVDYYGFHSYSGGGRLIAALSLLDGRTGYSDVVRDMVYRCQLCGSCDVTCKICLYNMDVLEALHEIRAKFVEDGHGLPQHESALQHLRAEQNMLMVPNEGRGDWAKGLGLKDLRKEHAEVAFFAGCRAAFDGAATEAARTAVTILRNAGVDLGIFGDAETCCGSRAYSLGYRDDFGRLARSNLDSLNKAGVRVVATSCAECYWAFKRLYPQHVGSGLKVLHTVELVDELIRNGDIKLTRPVHKTVTYHDPCHLGRQGEPYIPWNGSESRVFGTITKHVPPKPRYNGSQGVYDPPRRILAAIPGLQFVEMERVKECAWCCGAGAGVREAFPEFSSWTAEERIAEAESTGARTLLTACPWCERNFMDTADKTGHAIEVTDLVELVQQAI